MVYHSSRSHNTNLKIYYNEKVYKCMAIDDGIAPVIIGSLIAGTEKCV